MFILEIMVIHMRCLEPARGNALKHARQDKVNPVATILSGAWMINASGEKHISDAIFKATEQTIDDGKFLTYDLGGSSSRLSKMAEAIAQRSAALIKK